MKHSDQIDKIIPALVKAKASIKNPAMNSQVSYGNTKFKYADLSACLKAVEGPLLAEGIIVICDTTPLDDHGIGVSTRLQHTSGQFIQTDYLPMPVKANDPQAVGSARTYGFRYTLCDLTAICGEEDTDGQVAQQAKPEAMPKKSTIPAKRVNEVCEQINGAAQVEFLQGLWAELSNDERSHARIAAAKESAKQRLNGGAA